MKVPANRFFLFFTTPRLGVECKRQKIARYAARKQWPKSDACK